MLVVVEVNVLWATCRRDFVAGTVVRRMDSDQALAILRDVDWFVFRRVVRIRIIDEIVHSRITEADEEGIVEAQGLRDPRGWTCWTMRWDVGCWEEKNRVGTNVSETSGQI